MLYLPCSSVGYFPKDLARPGPQRAVHSTAREHLRGDTGGDRMSEGLPDLEKGVGLAF